MIHKKVPLCAAYFDPRY